MERHTCKYFVGGRNLRICKFCGMRWYMVEKKWLRSMSVKAFAEKWLPAVSGTDPQRMLMIDVAFPFEWNSYESWNTVMRVRFDFTDVLGRREAGLGTPTDIMNGWRSDWKEDLAYIDAQAARYYAERTGKPYQIGDNTYDEMRDIIQS